MLTKMINGIDTSIKVSTVISTDYSTVNVFLERDIAAFYGCGISFLFTLNRACSEL